MNSNVHTWTIRALELHREFVARLARSLVADENEAEDLEQEAWLVALRKGSVPVEGARAWLARVLRTLALTRRRTEARRAVREGEARATASAPAAGRAAEDLELQQRVVGHVLALDEPYKSTLLLRYYRELSHADIAREMDVPIETVRTRLKRARERLRAALDGEYGARTQWCVALVALTRSPAPVIAGTGSTVLTTLGGMLMTWKTMVAAGALLAALGLIWRAGREPRIGAEPAEAPSLALVPQELEGEPGEDALITDSSQAASARAAVPETRASEPEEQALPGLWLVGRVTGPGLEPGSSARIDLALEEFSEPLLEYEAGIEAPFELDLAPLFARDGPRQTLFIEVAHPACMFYAQRLELDPRAFERHAAGARAEIEFEIRLVPFVAEIVGSVTQPFGTDAHAVQVALVRLNESFPPSRDQVDLTSCDEHGHFRLITPELGPFVVVAWDVERSQPPWHTVTHGLDLTTEGRVRLPPFNMDAGDIISGTLLAAPGEPLVQVVRAMVVTDGEFDTPYFFRGRELFFRGRELRWVDGSFELSSVDVLSDGSGRFRLTGLGPHSYVVVNEPFRRPRPDDGEASVPIHRLPVRHTSQTISGTIIEAPAAEIELGTTVVYSGFQVFAGGAPARKAEFALTWSYRDKGGGSMNGTMEARARTIFAFPAGDTIDAWVVFSAPGSARSTPIDLNEGPSGFEYLRRIDLAPAPYPVNITIRLELWEPGEVGEAWCELTPWPEGAPRPDSDEAGPAVRLTGHMGMLASVAGEFRIERVTPGRYWCVLMPSPDNAAKGALPWRSTSFAVEVAPGADYRVTRVLGPGGQLRVVAVHAHLLDEVMLRVHTAEGQQVRDARLVTADGGALQMIEAQDPGEYVLSVLSQRFVEQELPFVLVDGEVTEIVLELQPR